MQIKGKYICSELSAYWFYGAHIW